MPKENGRYGPPPGEGRLAHDRAQFSTESLNIASWLKAELLALPLSPTTRRRCSPRDRDSSPMGVANFHLAYTLAPMAAAKAGDSTAVSKETAMQYRDGTDRATISVGITAPNGGRSEKWCAARSTSRFLCGFPIA
jgi:hypothetical protein